MHYPFDRPAKSLAELFELICTSGYGRTIVGDFQASQQRIEIKSFPQELKFKLRESQDRTAPLGAAFITDGTTGTILLDLESPMGIAAPFLFHEMIHSLDRRLWSAAQQTLSRSTRREIIFQSECRAFRAQHVLQEQLKAKFSNLRDYHLEQFPHIPFLNRALEPHEIQTGH